MAYKGRYTPQNKGKYAGNPSNVIYRSLWERKRMKWCDLNPDVIKWGSEETVIPYVSPLDNKIHRYFVDFYIQVKTKDGLIKSYLVEVKPKKYTKPPETNPKKKSKSWFSEVKNWGETTTAGENRLLAYGHTRRLPHTKMALHFFKMILFMRWILPCCKCTKSSPPRSRIHITKVTLA